MHVLVILYLVSSLQTGHFKAFSCASAVAFGLYMESSKLLSCIVTSFLILKSLVERPLIETILVTRLLVLQ